MVDFSEYSIKELYSIYYSVQFEIMKRQWWLIALAAIGLFIFYYRL